MAVIFSAKKEINECNISFLCNKKAPEQSGATIYHQFCRRSACSSFFHPDFTVGTGITPVHAAMQLADYTAGRELHPTPK